MSRLTFNKYRRRRPHTTKRRKTTRRRLTNFKRRKAMRGGTKEIDNLWRNYKTTYIDSTFDEDWETDILPLLEIIWDDLKRKGIPGLDSLKREIHKQINGRNIPSDTKIKIGEFWYNLMNPNGQVNYVYVYKNQHDKWDDSIQLHPLKNDQL